VIIYYRFGIECTTSDNGTCVEFPSSTRSLLSVIRLLHVTANEKSTRRASLEGENTWMLSLLPTLQTKANSKTRVVSTEGFNHG